VFLTLSEEMQTSGVKVNVNFIQCPSIITIKAYLNSILYNLVSNAIKYRDQNRSLQLDIAASKIDHMIQLSIKDNGRASICKSMAQKSLDYTIGFIRGQLQEKVWV